MHAPDAHIPDRTELPSGQGDGSSVPAPAGAGRGKRALDIAVICLFCAAICSFLVYYIFFYTERNFSIAENRPLQVFSVPTAEALADGSFMSLFETAVSDQAPGRDLLLALNKAGDRGLSRASYLLFAPGSQIGKPLALLDGNITLYSTAEGWQLLQNPFLYDEALVSDGPSSIRAGAEGFAAAAAALPGTRIFVTDIEPVFLSAASPLNSLYPDAVAGRYSDALHRFLPEGVASLSLRAECFDDILHYYYRTDHHLNGYGAALAYETLYAALSQDTPELGPALDVSRIAEVPNTYGCGSKARSANYAMIRESLSEPVVELPEYAVTLDGESYPRSHAARVRSGEYLAAQAEEAAASGQSVSPYLPYYAEYFGYDYGEVVYDNPEAPNDRVLLLVGPSYTQTFEQLLAAHYRRVHVIDPRQTDAFAGGQFDLIPYAQQIGADDIVYFIQPQYLADPLWQVR